MQIKQSSTSDRSDGQTTQNFNKNNRNSQVYQHRATIMSYESQPYNTSPVKDEQKGLDQMSHKNADLMVEDFKPFKSSSQIVMPKPSAPYNRKVYESKSPIPSKFSTEKPKLNRISSEHQLITGKGIQFSNQKKEQKSPPPTEEKKSTLRNSLANSNKNEIVNIQIQNGENAQANFQKYQEQFNKRMVRKRSNASQMSGVSSNGSSDLKASDVLSQRSLFQKKSPLKTFDATFANKKNKSVAIIKLDEQTEKSPELVKEPE